MSSEMLAFLRAQFAHIDAVARAARQEGGDIWGLVAHERGDGAIYDDMGTPVLMYDVDDPDTPGPAQAAHMALNDPCAARDWAEAQRRILDLLEGTPYAEEAARILVEQYRAEPGCRPEWRLKG